MSIYEDAADALSVMLQGCACNIFPVLEIDAGMRVLCTNTRVLHYLVLSEEGAKFFEEYYGIKPTNEFGGRKYYTQHAKQAIDKANG